MAIYGNMAGNKNSGNKTVHPYNDGNRQFTETRKQQAEAVKNWKRQGVRVPRLTQEAGVIAFGKIWKYIDDTVSNGEPLTVAGMVLASGMSRDTFKRITEGERDYLLNEYLEKYGNGEYITDNCYILEDNNSPFDGLTVHHNEEVNCDVPIIPLSLLYEKCLLRAQEQSEIALHETGRTAEIFNLKAVHGWRDGSEADNRTVTNNTLVIADAEEARQAIKLLG